jgi:predicted phosphodiesterase
VRYLILSDLHANLEALDAVVREAAGAYDQIICCGDLVGYGADPNPVTLWVRENCPVVVRGNHDRASTGQDDLEWFNPVARQAAVWTLQNLTPDNAQYIHDLPRGPIAIGEFEIVHGSPYDEDEYVVGAGEAGQAFDYLQTRVAFFGHTHVQGGFIWNQSRVETIMRMSMHRTMETLDIDPDCAYLINPGSVGQPRDGDPRAAYAVYDSDAQRVAYHRVEYDVASAQRRIQEEGLPPILAERLAIGR